MTVAKSDAHPDLPSSWKFWQKRRYIVVMMAFFGLCNLYALRVNLSVGIVAMTENRTVHYDNGTVGYEQYFNWDTKYQQGFILSSFFYGYILTQLLGGYLGAKFGGSVVFGGGILGTSILTLLTPVAANAGVYVLIAVRFMMGICQGVAFPSIQDVWSRWCPPNERSRMSTISFVGTYAGTVLAMAVSGILATEFGWESIFYVFGIIGCIWFLAWWIIVKRDPEQDCHISKEELKYIQSSLGLLEGNRNSTIPWKAIFISKAVLALCVAHTCALWGLHTFITQLPKFLKEAMKYDLDRTGFISAAPYLTMAVLLPVFGYYADLFQIKGYMTTTQVRRNFNCFGFVLQAFFLLVAAYFLHPVWSVICIILSVGFGAMASCGFYVNALDIAPNYASVIFGITNTLGTVPGILSPSLTSYLTEHNTAEEWRVVFYIAAGIYGIGAVIYWFWCSGETQPWAKNSAPKDGSKEKPNGEVTSKV